MSGGFEGQAAVVTGGASGIGRAVVRRLIDEGARVAVVDLDGAAAAEVVEETEGAAIALQADIASEEDTSRYMDAAAAELGPLSLFHFNAGTAGALVAIDEMAAADFDRVVATNLRGAFLGLRAAIRHRREQGGGGSIVATSSGFGLNGGQGWSAYAASKHGILGLVRSAALDCAADGIRVNALVPGLTDTPMIGDPGGAGLDALIEALPLGRLAQPEDVAGVVAFLLGRDATYVTGAAFSVDGGVGAIAAGLLGFTPGR